MSAMPKNSSCIFHLAAKISFDYHPKQPGTMYLNLKYIASVIFYVPELKENTSYPWYALQYNPGNQHGHIYQIHYLSKTFVKVLLKLYILDVYTLKP